MERDCMMVVQRRKGSLVTKLLEKNAIHFIPEACAAGRKNGHVHDTTHKWTRIRAMGGGNYLQINSH